ncbi:MAG: peroxiredoxin family protein [Gammaproteobacteria bacterium]
MRLNALLPALILAFTATTTAADSPWGPAVGSAMPADLAASTQAGEIVALSELASSGNGLVVAFVRSADWCPFCKRQLIELSTRAEDFEKRDYTLVSVSYDSADILKSFGTQFEIGYDLLSDPDSAIIDAFGIRNEDQKPGSAGDGIPHPGIMVFDTDGTLVAKFAEKSYRKRPKIDDVLAAIDGLK